MSFYTWYFTWDIASEGEYGRGVMGGGDYDQPNKVLWKGGGDYDQPKTAYIFVNIPAELLFRICECLIGCSSSQGNCTGIVTLFLSVLISVQTTFPAKLLFR